MQKLPRPWNRSYRLVDRRDPHMIVVRVYSPKQIQVHQNQVTSCPPELPSEFFCYGTWRARPGQPPKWVNQLLQGDFFTDPYRSRGWPSECWRHWRLAVTRGSSDRESGSWSCWLHRGHISHRRWLPVGYPRWRPADVSWAEHPPWL